METLYFISIGVLTVITCIFIILYFKQRSSSVPRTVYNELNDQFNLAQSNLKVLEEKASTLQATNESLTQKLGVKESESIQYQTDISSLKTTLTNRDERFAEISQKLRDEIEVKQKYQDQISENNRTMAELSAQNSSLVEQLENQKNSAKQLKEQLQELTNHQIDLKENISRLNAQNETLTEKLQTQKQEVAELQRTAHLQFEKIATKLLDEKSQKFTENNKSNIETLLKPLKEDIQRFKSQVEETHKEDTKQRVSLEERIRNLIEQTNKVSEEANNLATALKGKPQKRGNWGEIILERILEDSELTKDREYFVQNSLKDKDGNILRPDVQVKLPDDRIILIDSKVSLNAYDRYSSSEDKEEQKIFLMDHLKSTQDHIDQFRAKRYDDLESSLDFTMMFIPIESASAHRTGRPGI